MATNKLNKAKLVERIRAASEEEVNKIRDAYGNAVVEYAAKKETWQKEIKAWLWRHIDDAEFSWNPPDDPAPHEPRPHFLDPRGRHGYELKPDLLPQLIRLEEERRDAALRYVELIDGDTVTVASNEYPPFRHYL